MVNWPAMRHVSMAAATVRGGLVVIANRATPERPASASGGVRGRGHLAGWLSCGAQVLYQLLSWIGIRGQAELHLCGFDARARCGAEFAIGLPGREAASCQQLLQLFHLLQRPFRH